jgi:hypothetical protein
MSLCEWKDCGETATHSVEAAFPGEAPEPWNVCRSHDRRLKLAAVRSRPAAPPPVDAPAPANVACGQCGHPLEEPPGRSEYQPALCPACGSVARHVTVSITDTVSVHESVRARTKRAGKGGWVVDTRSGDDYTKDLEAWGRRELTLDRERDVYREVIELYDGTRIVSTARLTDHQG